MYNFNLEKNENIYAIFDDVLVSQENNSMSLTIAVTDKRILFLDYQPNELLDTLKGAQASSYIRMKEVIFYRKLFQIKELKENKMVFDDNYIIGFDNKELYLALKKVI